jgi:3-oxoacyl-[acyl-carrier protein] reductase
MDLKLKDKRACVTGASSGLGVGIAKMLASEGVSVVVQGRDEKRTAQTVAEIKAAGGKAFAAIGSLSTNADAERIADIADQALGGIDILVNNAGGSLHNHDNPQWHEIIPQDYLDSININLVGAVRLARRFAPGMCERRWGRIINISSIAGRQALGALHEYGPAKAALENWGLNVSKNLAPFNVTVNTIAPGMIMTAAARAFMLTLRDQNGWPDDMAEIERRYATDAFPQPIKHIGRPENIAAAVVFLASEYSNYTTGAVLRIDGGASAAL